MITRRTALKRLGAAAGVAAVGPKLLGCGDEGPAGPGRISHLIVVCMENRSYDHYLGSRALEGLGGEGLVAGMSNPDSAGTSHEIFHEAEDCVTDPPHGWNSSRVQFNGGLNDGFVRAMEQSAPGFARPELVMGYYTREDLPWTHAAADAFTSCDRWFCSLMGPTWPNRMYLMSGQSGGLSSNDFPVEGDFLWPTIFHRLNDASIDWRYYFSDLPFLPLWRDVDPASGTPQAKITRVNQFYADAQRGALPPFAMIEPAFGGNDDHPPHHPILGQQFLASIYAALAASPQWEETLLVITYDEHGGFFDHVAPPTAPDERAAEGFDQLGFRVPSLVIGPWVKAGHVSSVTYDHTSVLAQARGMFGTPALTMRDAAANDLSDAIDAERLAAGDALAPPELPAVEVDESMIDEICFGKRSARTDIARAADAGVIPRAYDRRAELRDTLFAIGDELARLNRGGVRRGR